MACWPQFSLALATIILICCVYESATKDNIFDYFVFTQEWPWSMCFDAEEKDDTESHIKRFQSIQVLLLFHIKCNVPSLVKDSWTIHGLWPDKYSEKGPSCCNNSWPFDLSKIKSLQGQLEQYWPNLYPKTAKYDFWKHEWDKHGTCSTSLPATGNEYLYFKKALQLCHRFNILNMLAKKGIIPSSNETYEIEDIWKVLIDTLGVKANISCVHYNGTFYVGQVKICLTKSFNLLDCGKVMDLTNSYLQDCPTKEKKDQVHYPLPSHFPKKQQINVITV